MEVENAGPAPAEGEAAGTRKWAGLSAGLRPALELQQSPDRVPLLLGHHAPLTGCAATPLFL